MSIYKYGWAAVLALGLVACGGGGGNAGTPNFGAGTGGTGGTGGTDGGGTGGTTQPAYQMTLQLQNAAGVDIANNSFAASDSVKLLATLKTAAGAPAAYEVVSFAESGSGLLQFTPASATALTNINGQAVVEAKAKDLVSQGATTATATATVAGEAYSAFRNLSVTPAAIEGVDPQTLANSVDFVSVVPADSAIVPANAGGIGRTKTAILHFKVEDMLKAGIPGVRVEFTVPGNLVTLSSATGITDANGVVSVTVSSTNQKGTVAVTARIPGALKALQALSNVLTVDNGPVLPGSFDLSASKRVLNNDISGDASLITVRLVDAGGARIPDGFALVASTRFGGVGDSSGSACVLANGECPFSYTVQNPRSPDGKIEVLVSGVTANGVTISDTIQLFATSVKQISLFDTNASTTPKTVFSDLTFDSSCKAVWTGELGTINKIAAPAGASLSAESLNSVVKVAVTKGSPVKDSLDGSRTLVNLTFSLDKATKAGDANLQFTVSAGGVSSEFAAKLNYSACTPAP